jgi:hypothetical protein
MEVCPDTSQAVATAAPMSKSRPQGDAQICPTWPPDALGSLWAQGVSESLTRTSQVPSIWGTRLATPGHAVDLDFGADAGPPRQPLGGGGVTGAR